MSKYGCFYMVLAYKHNQSRRSWTCALIYIVDLMWVFAGWLLKRSATSAVPFASFNFIKCPGLHLPGAESFVHLFLIAEANMSHTHTPLSGRTNASIFSRRTRVFFIFVTNVNNFFLSKESRNFFGIVGKWRSKRIDIELNGKNTMI